MTRLLADGTLLDWIIALTLIEAAGLALFHRLTGRGVAMAVFLPNLLSGLCLLFGMRLVLGGAAWWLVCSCLLAALGFHLAELRRQWQKY